MAERQNNQKNSGTSTLRFPSRPRRVRSNCLASPAAVICRRYNRRRTVLGLESPSYGMRSHPAKFEHEHEHEHEHEKREKHTHHKGRRSYLGLQSALADGTAYSLLEKRHRPLRRPFAASRLRVRPNSLQDCAEESGAGSTMPCTPFLAPSTGDGRLSWFSKPKNTKSSPRPRRGRGVGG
jgi:hypothetical protein